MLQDLESDVLGKLNFDTTFYYRNVDDIVTLVPISDVDIILEKFNSYHPRLQFTIEIGNDKINFLNTTVIIVDN